MRATLAFAVLIALGLPQRAQAYTLVIDQPNGPARQWSANASPILIEINDQTGPQLANMAPGSDPFAALERALTTWPAAANISFTQGTTSIADAGNDGHNIMTFVDTPANRQAFEMAGNPVGLTLISFIGSEIQEADVFFNPTSQFTTTLDDDDSLGDANLQDAEAVAVHELGHLIGLHHTGVEAASMWPLTSVLQRTLAADDVAGARVLYPVGGVGEIHGSVTVGGAPAFGAHVVALGGDGTVAASAVTLPDGSFTVGGLAPGTYTAYVEPLDGPHSSIPDGTCVRVGNIFGGGLYNGATLDTDFRTMFLGGNETPTPVVVTAGGSEQIDFSIAADSAAGLPNPTAIGPAMVFGNGGVSVRVRFGPLRLNRDEEQFVTVAGPDLDTVPAEGISFSGTGVEVDPSSLIKNPGLAISCGGDLLPTLVFRVTVAANAAPGARSLFLRVGGSMTAMTASVDIAGEAVPAACLGDCSGDGEVTVDEILLMVNIALGDADISECLAGDGNGDQQVTVEEIIGAVNNALQGCPVA
jgi:hypothetical protein